jgi:hypothetical protein
VLSGLMAKNYDHCFMKVLDRFGMSRSLIEMCVKRKNGLLLSSFIRNREADFLDSVDAAELVIGELDSQAKREKDKAIMSMLIPDYKPSSRCKSLRVNEDLSRPKKKFASCKKRGSDLSLTAYPDQQNLLTSVDNLNPMEDFENVRNFYKEIFRQAAPGRASNNTTMFIKTKNGKG